jgi:hypothetical protein
MDAEVVEESLIVIDLERGPEMLFNVMIHGYRTSQPMVAMFSV